jgi:hypothetical protein
MVVVVLLLPQSNSLNFLPRLRISAWAIPAAGNSTSRAECEPVEIPETTSVGIFPLFLLFAQFFHGFV